MLSVKGKRIDQYTVTFPIKEGKYAETSRVKDATGKNYFLKLLDFSKMSKTQFSTGSHVLELEISQLLHHPNLITLHDAKECVVDGQKRLAIVYEFISGETLAQYFSRDDEISVHEAVQIAKRILSGLAYMHSLSTPILHNEITLSNIMLDLSTTPSTPKIIDLGHARFLTQPSDSFPTDIDSYYFCAPESFQNKWSVQSDIYSVGSILYTLIFGAPPYFDECAHDFNLKESLADARLSPPHFPEREIFEFTPTIAQVIKKALAYDLKERFASASEMLAALEKPQSANQTPIQERQTTETRQKEKTISPVKGQIKKGNGFADVAGMQELKEQLTSDVIDVIRNPGQAKKLGISIPNGLLFYGPPGCGKTFFAEKFAEELGCNYLYVKCSDIASPYIHGGQSKIANLFKEARKKAPTIVFFDEIEAMVRDRNLQSNASEAGEVNEFLTQLNNCGQDGVIVIGATNNPTTIDPAALRSGRFDCKYYIPNPDKETRAKLFEVILKNRQKDDDIDYNKLSSLTDNFVSADIRLVIDRAARLVFKRKLKKISMTVLLEILASFKPSVSLDTIREQEAVRDQFNGVKQNRKPIGFC